MRKIILPLLLLVCHIHAIAQEQPKRSIRIFVTDDRKNVLPGSTVYLLNHDSVVIRTAAADTSGSMSFIELNAGKYRVRASQAGYEDGYGPWIDLEVRSRKL